jgi:hypothetical protein
LLEHPNYGDLHFGQRGNGETCDKHASISSLKPQELVLQLFFRSRSFDTRRAQFAPATMLAFQLLPALMLKA